MSTFSPGGRDDGCCATDRRYPMANRILSASDIWRTGDGISKRLIAAIGHEPITSPPARGVPESTLRGNQDGCRACPVRDKYLAFGVDHGQI